MPGPLVFDRQAGAFRTLLETDGDQSALRSSADRVANQVTEQDLNQLGAGAHMNGLLPPKFDIHPPFKGARRKLRHDIVANAPRLTRKKR